MSKSKADRRIPCKFLFIDSVFVFIQILSFKNYYQEGIATFEATRPLLGQKALLRQSPSGRGLG
jgi:hypothetical protein